MYDLDFIVRRMFLIILVVLGISVTLFILQTVTIYYAARIGNNGINPDMDSYHLSVRRGYAISPILHKCFVVVAYGCQISVRELRFFLLTGCCMIIFQFLKRKYTVREKGVYVKQLERAGAIALDLEFVTQMLMGWQNDVWYVPTVFKRIMRYAAHIFKMIDKGKPWEQAVPIIHYLLLNCFCADRRIKAEHCPKRQNLLIHQLRDWDLHMQGCQEKETCAISLASQIFIIMRDGGRWEDAVEPMAKLILNHWCLYCNDRDYYMMMCGIESPENQD